MKTKRTFGEVLDMIAILVMAFFIGAFLRMLLSVAVEAVTGVKWPWYLF